MEIWRPESQAPVVRVPVRRGETLTGSRLIREIAAELRRAMGCKGCQAFTVTVHKGGPGCDHEGGP